MMSPVLVAYGRIGGDWRPTGDPVEGACGACGRRAEVWEALGVVSRRFSSWDLIRTDAAAGRRLVCAPCAWALVSPGDLRRRRLHLTAGGGVGQWEWSQAADRLRAGPLRTSECLVVPVGGRKSVLPFAAWGCVVSDAGELRWGPAQARAARAGGFIRQMGAGERDLVARDAPGAVLSGLGAVERSRVRAAWRVWRPWMASQWAGVMIRATRGAAGAVVVEVDRAGKR